MLFKSGDLLNIKDANGAPIAVEITQVHRRSKSYELENKNIPFPLFLSELTLLKLLTETTLAKTTGDKNG